MNSIFGINVENKDIQEMIEYYRNKSINNMYPIISILEWNGTKIPRGAKVGNHFIDWTQNGNVHAGGELVGMYDRLIEFGPNDLQVMVLYTKETVIDIDGNPCKTI